MCETWQSFREYNGLIFVQGQDSGTLSKLFLEYRMSTMKRPELIAFSRKKGIEIWHNY
jgi:hypothetical protein